MTTILNGRAAAFIAILSATAIVATSGVVSAGVLGIFNRAPVAHNQSFSARGAPIEVTLHATDADGNKLSYAVTQEPQNGTLSGTAPSFLYTPAPGFSGTDSFTWRASDGTKSSNPATLSILNSPSQESQAQAQVAPAAVSNGGFTTAVGNLVADFTMELDIARPPGAVGCVMYMFIGLSAPMSAIDLLTATPDVPAGWTPVPQGEVNLIYVARGLLYYKVVTATEPPIYTLSFPAPTQVAAAIGSFCGIDPRAPLWQASSGAALTTVADPLVLPSIHAPAGSIVFAAMGSFGQSVSTPAPMIQRWRHSNGEVLGLVPLVDTETSGATEFRQADGFTGDRIANFVGPLPVATPVAAVGFLVSLRPAPGGGNEEQRPVT